MQFLADSLNKKYPLWSSSINNTATFVIFFARLPFFRNVHIELEHIGEEKYLTMLLFCASVKEKIGASNRSRISKPANIFDKFSKYLAETRKNCYSSLRFLDFVC